MTLPIKGILRDPLGNIVPGASIRLVAVNSIGDLLPGVPGIAVVGDDGSYDFSIIEGSYIIDVRYTDEYISRHTLTVTAAMNSDHSLAEVFAAGEPLYTDATTHDTLIAIASNTTATNAFNASITSMQSQIDNLDLSGGGGGGGSMSDSEVKTAYENNSNTNALVDSEKAALGTLASDLSGKSDTGHTHASDSSKSDTGHGHTTSDVTGLDTALSGKSDTGHGHAIADVTGLQTALDNAGGGGGGTTYTAGRGLQLVGDEFSTVVGDGLFNFSSSSVSKYKLEGGLHGQVGPVNGEGIAVTAGDSITLVWEPFEPLENSSFVFGGDGSGGRGYLYMAGTKFGWSTASISTVTVDDGSGPITISPNTFTPLTDGTIYTLVCTFSNVSAVEFIGERYAADGFTANAYFHNVTIVTAATGTYIYNIDENGGDTWADSGVNGFDIRVVDDNEVLVGSAQDAQWEVNAAPDDISLRVDSTVVRQSEDGTVLTNKATEPSNPDEGQFFFDSATKQFKGWNGTSWVVLG